MTIATLTGHAVLAMGPYSIVMDNGPARAVNTAAALQAAGDKVGDMFEISTIRREDWDFVKDKSGEFVSVLQCNNAPSSRTPRGHQFPAAFMMTVAGLDQHMLASKQPLKYRSVDTMVTCVRIYKSCILAIWTLLAALVNCLIQQLERLSPPLSSGCWVRQNIEMHCCALCHILHVFIT